MADMKECPLCGDTMRKEIREVTETIPGIGQTTTHTRREWVCPECEYWEEAENDGED